MTGLVRSGLDLLFGICRTVGDRVDQVGDFTGRLGGALGQLAHFVGYHGKAPALFPCACGFNGGVQCQQVGLVGNILDQLHKSADMAGVLAQCIHAAGSFALCADHVLEIVGQSGERLLGVVQHLGGIAGNLEVFIELVGREAKDWRMTSTLSRLCANPP